LRSENQSITKTITMKHCIIMLTVILCSAVNLSAQTFQAALDTIWGSYCYRELNGGYQGVSMAKSPLSWPANAATKMCYYLRMPAGYVKAKAVLYAKNGQTPKLQLRVIQASTGDTIMENNVTGMNTIMVQQMEIMPATKMPADTWYRFEVSSVNGPTAISNLKCLIFQRSGSYPVLASDIFMAPSTHLFTFGTTDSNAPQTNVEGNDWCYMEVMLPKKYQYPNTYVMSLGVLSGYMGIQSVLPSLTSRTWNHNVIFSMWDNGDTDKDSNLPSFMRSGALDKGDGVAINRFHGEGTGAQSVMVGDFWQPDNWVQFITHCRPEDVTVTVKGHDGQDSTIVYHNTLVTAWFKEATATEWHYMATLRESGRNHYFGGWYSFIENFTSDGGEFFRRAYFKNPYMRSLASGKWYNRNTVGYGHTQNTGARNSRQDYGHGMTSLYPNCFYLETGGYGNVNDSANTLPLVRVAQCVDTINLQRLQDRENVAILKDRLSAVNLSITNAEQTESTELDAAKSVAAELIAKADNFGSYRTEDLTDLIKLYDNGNCTDATALKTMMQEIASTKTPLKCSTINKLEHLGSFRAYQLQNAYGLGTVVGTTVDGVDQLKVLGATDKTAVAATKMPVNAVDPLNNWILLHSEKYATYYLYNIGLKKYLDMSQSSFLNANPIPVTISGSNGAFVFKTGTQNLVATPAAGSSVNKSVSINTGCYFNVLDNIGAQPSDVTVDSLLDAIDRYSRYLNYKTLVPKILELPDNVVGSIPRQENREKLKTLFNEGNLSFNDANELINFVDTLPCIKFEPEKTAYRVFSISSDNSATPYLTSNGMSALYHQAESGAPDQIWIFKPNGDGYTVMSQGRAIGKVGDYSGAAVNLTKKDYAGVIHLTNQGFYNYTFGMEDFPSYAINASTSPLKMDLSSQVASWWYLMPTNTIHVTLNAGGMAGIYTDFDMKMPDGLKACTINSVSEKGIVKLDTIQSGIVPALTPVLLLGEKNAEYQLNVLMSTNEALSGNLLKGTLPAKTYMVAHTYYVIDVADGKPVMSQAQTGAVAANGVYLYIGDGVPNLNTLSFDFEEADGIRGIHETKNADGKAYDLLGRPTQDGSTGIIINEGKKLIKKKSSE
jgi:hypothetical protein